jgi:hypothetical protein
MTRIPDRVEGLREDARHLDIECRQQMASGVDHSHLHTKRGKDRCVLATQSTTADHED